jgi:hypothetical protein
MSAKRKTPRRRPELVFEDALKAFLRAEGASLRSNVSERNTCGRLAIFLQKQLESDGFVGYYADPEYNRKQEGRVKTIIDENLRVVQITADLIAHTRGEQPFPHDNLIAVEAKKIGRSEADKDDDRVRLRAMTKSPGEGVWPVDGAQPEHVCGYAVGVFLDIDAVGRRIGLEYFKRGERTKKKEVSF